ncbi:MAG: YdcF family protein [Rhodanobacteraceae bacterium]|nr:MAG: YdcF family protein [Rhodanobacteraceae bacterium]
MIFPVYGTSPLLYAIVLLLLLLACWRRLPRAVRRAGVVIEVLLVVLMTPLGAWALTRVVLTQLPPPGSCNAPVPATIVVLSAGAERPPTGPDDYAALHLLTLKRLFTGMALWRETPGARLVISGGGYRRVPDAVVLARLAEQLGVPAASIEIEDRSRTTWDNARYVATLVPPVPKRIWLVTSAVHMPRALGAFRAWGFQPCAWPSGLQDTRLHFGPSVFVPQGEAVLATTFALHELFGQTEYAVLDWWHRRRAPARQTP